MIRYRITWKCIEFSVRNCTFLGYCCLPNSFSHHWKKRCHQNRNNSLVIQLSANPCKAAATAGPEHVGWETAVYLSAPYTYDKIRDVSPGKSGKIACGNSTCTTDRRRDPVLILLCTHPVHERISSQNLFTKSRSRGKLQLQRFEVNRTTPDAAECNSNWKDWKLQMECFNGTQIHCHILNCSVLCLESTLVEYPAWNCNVSCLL